MLLSYRGLPAAESRGDGRLGAMFSQEAFKTPKLQQPQSPAAAQTQLSHSSALSPFAPRVPRSSAAALSEQRVRTQAQAQEPPADNRLAARSHCL